MIEEKGAHVAPPSSERNRPCGEVPAYHTSGSAAGPGMSQKVWSTARPVRGSAVLAKAGGRAASFHVRPKSVERKTVGPKWPVLAAASSVRRRADQGRGDGRCGPGNGGRRGAISFGRGRRERARRPFWSRGQKRNAGLCSRSTCAGSGHGRNPNIDLSTPQHHALDRIVKGETAETRPADGPAKTNTAGRTGENRARRGA